MATTSPPQEPLTLGVSHVGLAVRDLAASLSFFEALGYNVVGGDTSYPSHFLSNGRSVVTLWSVSPDVAVPFDRKTNVGLHHLALQVSSESALDAAYEAALAVPGTVDEFGPRDFPFGKHAMLYEPSGIRIELSYHKE